MQNVDPAAYHPEAYALIRAFLARDYWTATRILWHLDNMPDGPGIGFAMVVASAAAKVVEDSYGHDRRPALELLDRFVDDAVETETKAIAAA